MGSDALHKIRKGCLVKPGRGISLSRVSADETFGFENSAETEALLQKNCAKLFDLQYRLYAQSRKALLIVLQAPDAGGKDGTIRHVFTAFNPQGCRVISFKVPTSEEARHDYLWRIHKEIPARGDIGIFNRSHYEDVLVPRVHKLVDKKVWERRYDEINRFERYLSDNGVVTVKFFLHISRDEQKKRLEKRVRDPQKNWKISRQDVEERKYWDGYQKAFEAMLNECSTAHAPWYVIPANHKWFRNFAVSQIVREIMEELDLRFPPPSGDLSKIRFPD